MNHPLHFFCYLTCFYFSPPYTIWLPVFPGCFSLVYHRDTAFSFPPSYSILMYFIFCLMISFICYFLAFISHTCVPGLHLVDLPRSSTELQHFPSYCFVLVYWFVLYFIFSFFSISHFANMYVYVCIPLLRLLVISVSWNVLFQTCTD